MLKILPFLLPVVYALLMYRFSVWRTKAMLDAASTPLDEPAIMAETAKLARALDLGHIAVHVYDIAPVNGLTAPDGRIFLTRGFLAKHAAGAVTAAELASVIAHELGHVALGHTRRRMIDFTGQNAVFAMLSAVLNRFLPGIGIWLARMAATALAARLSRRDEFEADAYASALLVKAGIGTGPQKTLFAKLGALTGSAGAGAGGPAWLLSHPKTADRIAAIVANEEKWGV
jgi:metalloprotease